MKHKTLDVFLSRFHKDSSIQALANEIKNLQKDDYKKLIDVYSDAITAIENCIWKDKINNTVISEYQSLFHEYEAIIKNHDDNSSRFNFIITIPVADRPQHLQSCLKSIFTLCENFQYGGKENGTYSKITVLISDDSEKTKSKNKNQEISESFTRQGLNCIYFGETQQKSILSNLAPEKLKNITGDTDPDKFFHKGASITRNISYLKLLELKKDNKPCLFYFIDSDQEFKINLPVQGDKQSYFAINYFYNLNKIFSEKKISILTGKVVGDPPVSPAVMAGTFIDDIISFIQKTAKLNPDQPCQFHSTFKQKNNEAAYHDMADLFGFNTPSESYSYHCNLHNSHNNMDCFENFSTKLNQFFDGEHPTRKSYYQYENLLDSIQPARTIYTGNYIFKAENLKYFIPFANLKLRMAGPVLGRIIQSELGEKFVSANLPMLHNRTVDTIGQSEFRPGVEHSQNLIDLSGEFIRQFFGDVMLFSVIELTNTGYPKKSLPIELITDTVHKTFLSIKERYINKQKNISDKITTLNKVLNNPKNWWNEPLTPSENKTRFIQFIKNIENNFGNNASIYQLINTPSEVDINLEKISTAIATYRCDRAYWQNNALQENIST